MEETQTRQPYEPPLPESSTEGRSHGCQCSLAKRGKPPPSKWTEPGATRRRTRHKDAATPLRTPVAEANAQTAGVPSGQPAALRPSPIRTIPSAPASHRNLQRAQASLAGLAAWRCATAIPYRRSGISPCPEGHSISCVFCLFVRASGPSVGRAHLVIIPLDHRICQEAVAHLADGGLCSDRIGGGQRHLQILADAHLRNGIVTELAQPM